MSYCREHGLEINKQGGKWGNADKSGTVVIKPQFSRASQFLRGSLRGLSLFRLQFSKWGYMDRTGKVVIRPHFDWAGNFSGGRGSVLLDNKCAHIDKTGKVIDQSGTVLAHQKYEQNSHGTFVFQPHSPPCSS
jgi:hypothetical protein